MNPKNKAELHEAIHACIPTLADQSHFEVQKLLADLEAIKGELAPLQDIYDKA
jgi:hypothetical protein